MCVIARRCRAGVASGDSRCGFFQCPCLWHIVLYTTHDRLMTGASEESLKWRAAAAPLGRVRGAVLRKAHERHVYIGHRKAGSPCS